MARNFGVLTFTPQVQALQEKYGSRRQYARMTSGSQALPDRLGPDEAAFIADRDSFYMATISETGWPYVQHRGGPKGFLKVYDEHTIAFPDYRGNRQYISTGNLSTDDRVSLILMDYSARARLKILGRAKVYEAGSGAGKDEGWIDRLRDAAASGSSKEDVIERAYVIRVEAFDWNCPQYITPRFTEDQIRHAMAPLERRMEALERENERLRQLTGAGSATLGH